MILSHPFL